MAANSTLLCIHRDPDQLSSLRENGYELVTATNGSEGLRLLRSRPVDAIVLEYHLGLLDGAVIAAEIKKVKPQLPIVMLADDLELPEGALKSVDALVTKSDGPHFLWATVHFVLSVKRAKHLEISRKRAQAPVHLRRLGRARDGLEHGQANASERTTGDRNAPLSPSAWRSILDWSIDF
jgi:DNA-binding response OmpR family regulator